jgi:hypothetical protein
VVPCAAEGIAKLVDSQSLEAIATAVIAGATILAAVGAVFAAIFAYLAIGENRRFNRTRLTVDLFETPMTNRFARTVNELVVAHLTLTNCRAYVQTRLANLAIVTREEREMFLDLLGIMGYAGELYAGDAINKELFLSRASEFVAVAFYILEPAIANALRTGLLRQNLVMLARDCVQYRNRIPRTFDDKPELRTYNIPETFPA